MLQREGLQMFIDVQDEIEELGDHAGATVRLQSAAANKKTAGASRSGRFREIE
jgi:hypothetical protein